VTQVKFTAALSKMRFLAYAGWVVLVVAFAGLLFEALAQEPKADLEAARSEGFALLRQGRWADADTIFEKLRSSKGDDPLIFYGSALAKFNLGQVPESGALIDTAVDLLEEDGTNPGLLADSLVLSAIVSARNGKDSESVSKLQKAVKLVPGHFDAIFSLARALYGRGDLKGAVIYFRDAVKQRPADLRARFFLATALENLGESREALEQYRTITTADPANADGHLGLGSLLLKVEGDGSREAEENLRKAVELRPAGYEARVTLGKLLMRKKEYDAAIVQLKAAAEIRPNIPEPHFQLSLAYGRIGKKDEAKAEMEIVKAIHEGRRGLPDDDN